MIDSLYALLKVQSFAHMIEVVDDGFFTIGSGTDDSPHNSYGSIFTFFNMDGSVRFKTFTLDTNRYRWYDNLRPFVMDTVVYTAFISSFPNQLIKFDIRNGEIIMRADYGNKAGGTPLGVFPRSIHLLDSSFILINTVGYAEHKRLVTQLCLYSISDSTFTYYFNDYPGYDQRITNILVSSSGIVLTGMIFRGSPHGPEYESRATVVWLDTAFQEVKRYLSPPGRLEGWGFDIVAGEDSSLIMTNCVGRQYHNGWSHYYDYTFRPSIYKLSSTGELLWHTPMGRNNYFYDDYWFSALLSSNLGDGYIAAGRQANFSDTLYFETSDTLNEQGENLRFEALIAKVSNEGDSLWSRFYYTADFLFSRARFEDMVAHPDGGYLICGSANKHPIVPDLPASYSWILHVDEYGCAVPGCHEIVKSEDPGLPDPIRFYPNPAMESIYLYQQEQDCIDYTILDMQGKLMHQHKNCQAGSTGIIDISSYPSGSYVLTKKDEKGRVRSEVWVKL